MRIENNEENLTAIHIYAFKSKFMKKFLKRIIHQFLYRNLYFLQRSCIEIHTEIQTNSIKKHTFVSIILHRNSHRN